MNDEFFKQLYHKQQDIADVPPNGAIAAWALSLLDLLFPERQTHPDRTIAQIREQFAQSERTLIAILNRTKACQDCNNGLVAQQFYSAIPELYRVMYSDASAIYEGDPAAVSEFEVIRTYPGFLAIALYRVAHTLMNLSVPLLPRILTEYAHSQTGIDIHPAAVIGEYFCIDHGTGVVIGETAVIGDKVKIYQGVTLGAMSVEKLLANTKRHPTIEDRVIIYAGATILGGDTVIGHDSIIGGNVWLTSSIPPYSTVYHQPTVKIVDSKTTH
ncbi:serine acetyltransferase [Parapedobacter sp. ISTM3]|uniref:serine O-acetyltransferase EpsC n=1 Tax=Parapedobacter sp. ISTM3 TaxID=2800130 RepID=UPI00190537D0|nr:serine O-acetyltransferase EpsC [Parapedobacter sp. ISTM3]MBK1441720.1 serine acetyltransferase [Parapedobacter sp. ISTM3]